MTDFEKFAKSERGVSSLKMHDYQTAVSRNRGAAVLDTYLNPTIIEERKLNAVSMDVFSRLMMDRIIFLGVPIDDDVANIIQAQLLFLASTDPSADISLYINSPGGQVTSGLGIYDTMQLVEPDVATICTGLAASMALRSNWLILASALSKFRVYSGVTTMSCSSGTSLKQVIIFMISPVSRIRNHLRWKVKMA